MSDEAHDREPAAAGGARAVPPRAHHRAAAHRLADARRARRGRRGRRPRRSITAAASKSAGIAATADDGSGATDELDVGAARLLRDQPPQPVGQEPIGHAVRPRHAAAARPTIRPIRRDTGGYGFNDYRGLFTFREPRAFGTTGDAQFTAFVEQGRRSSFNFNRRGVTADYARRLGAFTVTGRYTFDYTKLFDEQIAAGRSAADRSAVPAGQAVEDSSAACCATRAMTCSIRSAARSSASMARWRRGSPRLGSRLRQDVRAGLHLSPPAGPRRRGGGRRAPRPGGRASRRRCRRRSRSPRVAEHGGPVRFRATPTATAVPTRDQRAAGERAFLRRRRHHRARLRARSPRHRQRRSIRRAFRRAATAWRSSISRRARRTGRTCSSSGSSMPATSSAARPTSGSTSCGCRAASASAIDRRSGRCASTGAGSSSTQLLQGGGRERSNVLHISLGQAF